MNTKVLLLCAVLALAASSATAGVYAYGSPFLGQAYNHNVHSSTYGYGGLGACYPPASNACYDTAYGHGQHNTGSSGTVHAQGGHAVAGCHVRTYGGAWSPPAPSCQPCGPSHSPRRGTGVSVNRVSIRVSQGGHGLSSWGYGSGFPSLGYGFPRLW